MSRLRGDAAGDLRARTVRHAPVEADSGLIKLNGSRRPALLFVPPGWRGPSPLMVMLHGAGGTAQHSIDLVRTHAERFGFALLAPGSAQSTWDIIVDRGFGVDADAIDGLLGQVFDRLAVDPARLAIAGFSDGASYALSLGLTNGDLFSHVIAFSPGFMAPGHVRGRPKVRMSHGVADTVLPIDVCSRRIAPRLRSSGYDLDYREFPDGHVVPEDIATAFVADFATS